MFAYILSKDVLKVAPHVAAMGWSLQSVTAVLNVADHAVYLFTLAHCIASQLYLYYFRD